MFELIKNNDRVDGIDSFLNKFFNDVSCYNNNDLCFSSDEKFYYLEIALPGFSKKDISINVIDNYIEISSVSDDNKRSTWVHSFNKRVKLPSDVKENGIGGQLKDGILTIKLEKDKEVVKSRVIEIK